MRSVTFFSSLVIAAAVAVQLLVVPSVASAQVPCMCKCTIQVDGKDSTTTGCAQSAASCKALCVDKNKKQGKDECAPSPACGSPPKATGIPLPLGNIDPQTLIGRVIRAFLGLTGSLALVMFIYGGFLYMTAAGNEEQVRKGRNTIIWSVLGLVALFGAYTVVNFLVQTLNK